MATHRAQMGIGTFQTYRQRRGMPWQKIRNRSRHCVDAPLAMAHVHVMLAERIAPAIMAITAATILVSRFI
jgi:hypothetical protein